MHDLEPSTPRTQHRTCMSLVPRLSLARWVFEDNVTDLEDTDWQGVRAVFANGFQKPWEEGCAHDLEFEGFWVGNFYCERTRVWTVHEGEVFLMRALCCPVY